MALQGQIKVSHDDVFPAGAFVVGEVEPVEDFDKKQSGAEDPQQRDKTTGVRLWAVRVLDVDPESRRGQAEVVVKVTADVQPVPPNALPGMPFRPVVFENLTVTPWLDTNRTRPRIAYSFRATGMRAPSGTSPSSKAGGTADKAA